ncbi:MAG: nucleotide-binding protein [Bacteroidales bacterium]|nr:nucleotide-binding protein [Bacteroidales bacterium]MCF8458717.1 nucleotide-binding protein [Bacteroidales bacterium]
MALNPETVRFFITQLQNSEYRTFRSTVAQLFSYLSDEIKDNPIYDKYDNEREKWLNWPIGEDSFGKQWELPAKIQDAKSLAFDIYKSISDNDMSWADNFAFGLFRKSDLSENIINLNSIFLKYFAQTLEEIIIANPEIEIISAKKTINKTAFIIHGHDNELKIEVQLLLKRAGVNSIVLHERTDKGRTIIDKLIDETELAGYGIALLTPDDLIIDGNNRARQNVILEIGYFLGALGKARIRMIVKGHVEIPSDLQGILYEKYDASGAWKIKLLKELQAVGIYVDIQSAISEF